MTSPMIRRRALALPVLVVFLAGNVGLPLPQVGRGGGCCRVVAGKSVCCCSDPSRMGNCGCCRGATAVAEPEADPLPPCCQQRLRETEAHFPEVSNCPCGDASDPGFLVSSLPRIAPAVVRVAPVNLSARLPLAAACRVAACGVAPETPPPRLSVG